MEEESYLPSEDGDIKKKYLSKHNCFVKYTFSFFFQGHVLLQAKLGGLRREAGGRRIDSCFKFVATCVSEKTREKIEGVFPIFSLFPPISVTANVGETKMKQKRKMAPEPKNIFFFSSPPFFCSPSAVLEKRRGKIWENGISEFFLPSPPSLFCCSSYAPAFFFFFDLRTTVSRRPEPAVERCFSARARGRTDV